MKQLPVQQCPYCSGVQFGVGWQQDQALVTYRRNGVFGNSVKHLICKGCGAVLYSCVSAPCKYPPAELKW